LNLGSMVRKLRSIVAQLIARFHELSEDSCPHESSQSPPRINTKEEHHVSQ
jgi:hypothetical protein